MLQRLWEEEGLPADPLGEELENLYGGALGVAPPLVYANFVSSIDGVIAFDAEHASAGSAISGRNESDRFLMGLLRALADAVLVGAGTVRADAAHLWTAEHVYPPAAEHFHALRRRLGLTEQPRLCIVSASGELDSSIRALKGALLLRGRLSGEEIMAALQAQGYSRVLCEGGPHLLGTLMRANLIDELFLTVAPQVAGRSPEERRLAIVEGTTLLPEHPAWGRLVGVRRSESHLFLRYRFS